jgi:hypothetical protein
MDPDEMRALRRNTALTALAVLALALMIPAAL